MARTSALSKALLAVGAVSVLQLFRHEEAFVPSKIQGQAAASMAAALMAASVAAGPAQAESPKLSFFGLGGGVSDVYNQNDNPVNPYSQFSEVGSDSVYKARTDQEVTRRKKALTAAFERFDKTAFYIKTKQSQQLTSNLQEAAGFKQDGCRRPRRLRDYTQPRAGRPEALPVWFRLAWRPRFMSSASSSRISCSVLPVPQLVRSRVPAY
ncbi:unnamed protein product [Symbiodinium microadriaticum]|nr:unnamed protein product [Symbiodinium microadriaticum]